MERMHRTDRRERPKWMRWVTSKEHGYSVFTLIFLGKKAPIGVDCYLLKYPKGSSNPPHRDVLPTKKHGRINIILRRAVGGDFFTEESDAFDGIKVTRRTTFATRVFNIFRPDLVTHGVTEVQSGTRYVLSFGMAWGKK